MLPQDRLAESQFIRCGWRGAMAKGGDPQNPALSCGEGLASALLGLLGGDLSFIPERAAYWGNSL
jgi:hypothetical protein